MKIKKKCPGWDKWESSKCLWPTQNFSSFPKACVALPKKPEIEDVIKQFIQSKQLEIYSIVQNLFKMRGANETCGYCSRKIRCRQTKGGEWKKGCKFIDAQIVNEQCAGTKACVINSILGACPPPIPMPPPRRRRDDDQNSGILGNTNLDITLDKNATQGPPLWHCARSKDTKKCLCCCGWYFPDAKTGKCVNVRKNQTDEEDPDEESSWNWSGLTDFGQDYPYDLINDGINNRIIDQNSIPPMEREGIRQPDQNSIDPLGMAPVANVVGEN